MSTYIKRVLIYSFTSMFALLSLVGFSTAHAGCYTGNTYSYSCSPGSIVTNGYSTDSYSISAILSSPTASPVNSLTPVLWNTKVTGTKTTTVVQPVVAYDCTIIYLDYTSCSFVQNNQGAPTSSSTTFIPAGSVNITSPELSTQPLCTASVVNGVSSCSSTPAIKPGTYNYLATFIPAPNSGPTSSFNSNIVTLIEKQDAGFLVPILSFIQD